MAKRQKTVIADNGVDRRETGYYSTPEFIAEFMTRAMLEINPLGHSVLDPCVGKEELLGGFHKAGKRIDSFDVISMCDHEMSNFVETDFLDFYKEKKSRCIFDQGIDLEYDYYIANPPYNCHEVDYLRQNKKELNAVFEVGVYNMYSLFVSAMIDCAKPGSLIGVITLDSFLTSKYHSDLRTQILRECAIHHLILCPTDLFWSQGADVRTCMLILQKGKEYQGKVNMSNRPLTTEDLESLLMERAFEQADIGSIVLDDNQEFLAGCPSDIKALFDHPRLGTLFKCITGISTGNDRNYLSRVRDEDHTVPFYKNPGSRRFRMEPDGYLISGFMEESKRVSNFIVRNKSYLWQEGISCSSMGVPFTACYLPRDAVFGVNANIVCEPADLWWLLGYLNGSLVTYFVRGVLIRTNMVTSGYVSRIPIVPLDYQAKKELARISKHCYMNGIDKHSVAPKIREIDEIVMHNLELAEESVSIIGGFCDNLLRST